MVFDFDSDFRVRGYGFDRVRSTLSAGGGTPRSDIHG